jgi:hypothetical protein
VASVVVLPITFQESFYSSCGGFSGAMDGGIDDGRLFNDSYQLSNVEYEVGLSIFNLCKFR